MTRSDAAVAQPHETLDRARQRDLVSDRERDEEAGEAGRVGQAGEEGARGEDGGEGPPPASAVSSANSSRRALSDGGMRWYGVSVGAGRVEDARPARRGEVSGEGLGLALAGDDHGDRAAEILARAAASRIAGSAPTPPETTRRSSPFRTPSRRSA